MKCVSTALSRPLHGRLGYWWEHPAHGIVSLDKSKQKNVNLQVTAHPFLLKAPKGSREKIVSWSLQSVSSVSLLYFH